jgi:hypothetical protein
MSNNKFIIKKLKQLHLQRKYASKTKQKIKLLNQILDTAFNCSPAQYTMVPIREFEGHRWKSSVYLEISKESVKKFCDFANLSEDDVFCDLGSGAGKVVFQGMNYNFF